MTILAAEPGRGSYTDLFVYLSILLAVLLVTIIALALFRKWIRQSQDQASQGFTLQELRELHEQGELSDEEFAAARTAIIGAATRDSGGAKESPKSEDGKDTDENRKAEGQDYSSGRRDG